MKKIILSFLALALAASAQAGNYYVGTDYVKSNLKIGDEKAKPSQLSLRVGMEVWQQIALEAQYSESDKSDNLFRFDVDLERTRAVFARFISPEYDNITVDIALGYASSVLTVNGPVGTFSGTDTYAGFAWGIAAQHRLYRTPNASVRIAYQSLYNDGSLHIQGFSVGLTYNF